MDTTKMKDIYGDFFEKKKTINAGYNTHVFRVEHRSG